MYSNRNRNIEIHTIEGASQMSCCPVDSLPQKSIAKLNLKGQACRADFSDWQGVNSLSSSLPFFPL